MKKLILSLIFGGLLAATASAATINFETTFSGASILLPPGSSSITFNNFIVAGSCTGSAVMGCGITMVSPSALGTTLSAPLTLTSPNQFALGFNTDNAGALEVYFKSNAAPFVVSTISTGYEVKFFGTYGQTTAMDEFHRRLPDLELQQQRCFRAPATSPSLVARFPSRVP